MNWLDAIKHKGNLSESTMNARLWNVNTFYLKCEATRNNNIYSNSMNKSYERR